MSSIEIPRRLFPTEDFLKRKYRHMAAVTEGSKVVSYGECTLAGSRFINKDMGVSCHAEINAVKPIVKNLIKGI